MKNIQRNKFLRFTGACAASIVLLTACEKGFEEMNAPYNMPSSGSIGDIFNSNVSSLQVSWQEQATYHSFVYQITQQVSQYASSGYRMENASNEMWDSYYKFLANSKMIDTLIAADPNKNNMTNIKAMNKVLRAYRTIRMTENFGDIPYSKAGMGQYLGENIRPGYDKQSDIYPALINDLKWAVDNFSTSAAQVSIGSSETLFKNDIALWTKFANSLRLRAAVTMYDKNPTFAGAQIAEALNKPVIDKDEEPGLWPSKTPGLVFEMHAWSYSANQYIRLGTTMWSYLSSTNAADGSGIFDPRTKIFYEPNNAGQWKPYPQNPTTSTPGEGGDPYNDSRDNNWPAKGAGNIYSNCNYYFKDKNYIPELFITAAQVMLYKAEVYNRGMGVAKNPALAKSFYESGVKQSATFWVNMAMKTPKWVVGKPTALPTDAELAALLANPVVAYSATEATALSQIYAQMWIDGYRQPGDVWTLFRRTGGNLPKDPNNAGYWSNTYGIYHRYMYPTSEQDFNSANWRAATGGTESYSTKIWLEK
ncbi:MAG TPA: SusD/RagB family nutrient-binding outer membrane lipoprotein [Phnomibacter sp.]|nr:SusD/RagB family nutrient-binding outer membrane lipoprotein [Phnomibacter sp.]